MRELLQLNPDENETALLRPGQNAALPETVNEIFDIRALRQAGSYEKLLRELSLAFARMEAKTTVPGSGRSCVSWRGSCCLRARPRRRNRWRLGQMP